MTRKYSRSQIAIIRRCMQYRRFANVQSIHNIDVNVLLIIVNEPRTHHLSTRRDQSVFNRCRIGHSRLTHEFLLKGEPPPECIPCNCPLTIKHLLIECVDFNDVRQRFYQVPSLQDLFKTVNPEVILELLKAAAMYRLL